MWKNKLIVRLKNQVLICMFSHKKYVHSAIMTSAFIAISILKQSYMSQEQLTNFLFYLSQEALKEYLTNADIYKGKKIMSKNELIEMIITNKPITTTHFKKDEEMTKEQAIDLINTNQYMKKIAHITLILFIRMSHQECVHNLNDFI